MGKQTDLTHEEKANIVTQLAQGKKTLEISKELSRDHRTIKRFVKNVNHKRKRSDKGVRRKLTRRQVSAVKREAVKHPLLSSKQLFEKAGVSEVPRTSRCRILQTFAKSVKPNIHPPLTSRHKTKRVEWARHYMKVDFQTVLFTDECRATLDGPDGWSRGWLVNGMTRPSRGRRQQGGGSVMFWAALIGREVVGPFRVPDGLKMNAQSYTKFLQDNFIPWYRKQRPASFKKKIIFMQDNTPSHAARYTIAFLEKLGFKDEKLMIWPPASSDLNPIENYWSILKRHTYSGGRQYTSKDELWDGICKAVKNIGADQVQKLTNSVDSRLVEILSNKGCYVNK